MSSPISRGRSATSCTTTGGPSDGLRAPVARTSSTRSRAARATPSAAHASEVYAAIATLPAPLRDVVAAVDLAGLSYAEAASALGVPRGTVMSRLFRARARLAGALGRQDEGTLPE